MRFLTTTDEELAADVDIVMRASEDVENLEARRARREASLAALSALRARRESGMLPDRSEWRRAGATAPRRAGVVRSAGISEQRNVPLSVGEAIARLKGAVSGVLAGLWITGEVSGLYRSAAGHVYFKLKDASGLIACAAFAGALRAKPADFCDGDRIEVSGRADVYARGGDLQLVVSDWRPAGMGELYEAFLKLKARLEAEGLFAPERKKPLPRFVRRIAVVTSAQAAAWQDVRKTLARRTPWIRYELFETPVQGDAAPDAIVRAIARADAGGFELILLVRGGGSIEDLQAYNDERVARAVAGSDTPIISGIGHETDFTIADFAADLRASTPTAAAESVGPDERHWQALLMRFETALSDAFMRQLLAAEQRTDRAARLLERPDLITAGAERRLTAAAQRLDFVFRERLNLREARLAHASLRLANPDAVLQAKTERLVRVQAWCRDAFAGVLNRAEVRFANVVRAQPDLRARFDQLASRLETAAQALAALNPDRPMREGWVRASGEGGEIVSRAAGLVPGKRLSLTFLDGRALVLVEQVERAEPTAGANK